MAAFQQSVFNTLGEGRFECLNRQARPGGKQGFHEAFLQAKVVHQEFQRQLPFEHRIAAADKRRSTCGLKITCRVANFPHPTNVTRCIGKFAMGTRTYA